MSSPGDPSTGSYLDLKGSLQQFSPKNLAASVASQFLGEKTEAQKSEEQKKEAQAQKLQNLNQQEYQRQTAIKQAEDRQVVQEIIQTKSQGINQLGSAVKANSVLRTQTVGPDKSELSLVQKAIETARARKEREARARSIMSQQSSVQKGPQAEGGEKKVSMVNKMTSGAETSGGKKDDQDSLQRQAEQALGE